MKAVCFQCGKPKPGAWMICGACGRVPEEGADVAKSVLLSDHHLHGEDFGVIAERVQAGEAVELRAQDLQRIADNVGRTEKGVALRASRVAGFVAVLFLIAAITAVIIRSTSR